MDALIEQFLKMDNRTLWLAFAGVAIPWAVGAIANAAWPPLAKVLLTWLTCVATAGGFIWAYDSFQTDDLPRLVLLFAVVSIGTYFFYKKGIAHWEVLTDRMLGREPADSLSPPVTAIDGQREVVVEPQPPVS